MGDGRAEGSLAIGDRGYAAVSFRPDLDGTGSFWKHLHVHIFES